MSQERFAGSRALLISARPLADLLPSYFPEGQKKGFTEVLITDACLQARQGPAFSFPRDFYVAERILIKYHETRARGIPMANQSIR